MIPASFEYTRARTLREALNTLAQPNGTKVVAGGHSLIPLLRFRLAQPSRLLDIGGLPELKGIDTSGRKTRIGAATTYRELLDSAELTTRFPVLAEAAAGVGDLQVRNAGTVGGGLAHADPASDLPAVMLVLGAEFTLRSKAGKRAVAAADFFQGAFTTALRDDELLVEIILPPLPRGAGSAYRSMEQQASGYALAGAAAVVTRSRKTVKSATLALTGIGERAYLADVSSLGGTTLDAESLQRATADLTRGVEVNQDIHASAEYRAHLAGVVARRALQAAYEAVG